MKFKKIKFNDIKEDQIVLMVWQHNHKTFMEQVKFSKNVFYKWNNFEHTFNLFLLDIKEIPLYCEFYIVEGSITEYFDY